MTTTDVRTTASNILGGMTFNKEKLARNCLEVCDLVDRLTIALAQERKRNAALALDLKGFRDTSSTATSSDELPPDFLAMFAGRDGKEPKFPF
jgi:hypothetical protein